MSNGLKIKPKFRDLIPPLTTHERQQLHDNIVADGCVTETIKAWDGVIVDGHNRYEIATEEGLEYAVEEYDFDSEVDAIEWILKNQLGRRNLSPDDASKLRGRLYNQRKKSPGRPKKRGQSEHVSDLRRTEEVVAEETGVSPATVRRDGKYVEALDSLSKPVKEAIESKQVKASRDDVKALAEYDKQSQKQIVEAAIAEGQTLGEAMAEPDDDPEQSREEMGKAELKKAKQYFEYGIRALDDAHGYSPSGEHGGAINAARVVLRAIQKW